MMSAFGGPGRMGGDITGDGIPDLVLAGLTCAAE